MSRSLLASAVFARYSTPDHVQDKMVIAKAPVLPPSLPAGSSDGSGVVDARQVRLKMASGEKQKANVIAEAEA
eukprot:2185282-Pyramimonas_sp.AAC.1